MTHTIDISIFADATCPFCYIGKKKLEQALAQRPQITANMQWLPYQLNPEAAAEGRNYRERMIEILGTDEKFDEAMHGVRAMGAEVGLELKPELIENMPNTLKALTLIYLATPGEQQNNIVEDLYQSYYCQAKDIGKENVLLDIGEDAGMEREWLKAQLSGSIASAQVRQYSEQAKSQGITGVPAFILNNKHLVRGAYESDTFVQLLDQIVAG
ncbi:MAG: DsbA family oxidoreductase [Pseudomonadales bacterium]